MKTLLISYCSQTGNTEKLAKACYESAIATEEKIRVYCKAAPQVSINQILQADAYIFATPENFGYMNGELKSLFDRTYHACREQTAGSAYALIISCDNDGQGAKAAIERILAGYNMKNSELCLIAKGQQPQQRHLEVAKDIGQYMAVALANGIL